MSQLEPTVELLAPPPVRVSGRRLHVPGWLLLLLKNPKSCAGLAMVAFVVVIALIAPLISVAHPNEFNLLAARQAPTVRESPPIGQEQAVCNDTSRDHWSYAVSLREDPQASPGGSAWTGLPRSGGRLGRGGSSGSRRPGRSGG